MVETIGTEEAFLAAIQQAASRGDDTSANHAVYSDWLLEQGRIGESARERAYSELGHRWDWRSLSEKIIRYVLGSLHPDANEATKRWHLKDAYPFGPRKYHPYKQWCRCVREALGLKRVSKQASKEWQRWCAKQRNPTNMKAPLFDR